MRLPRQKLFASLTAAVILFTSLNCWCGASQSIASDCDHCPEHKNKTPDHSCLRGQGTLVSETSTFHNLATPFDHVILLAAFDTKSWDSLPMTRLGATQSLTDLPPTCGPPTLLSLHCALIF